MQHIRHDCDVCPYAQLQQLMTDSLTNAQFYVAQRALSHWMTHLLFADINLQHLTDRILTVCLPAAGSQPAEAQDGDVVGR